MVEPLHMHILRDLLHRLRVGETQRQVARDLGIARETVSKYHRLAEEEGLLSPDQQLPEEAVLHALFGMRPEPPRTPSTVEPYREVVEALLEQGVEMVAIHARLCQDHGYTGSYSSVRRFVAREHPQVPQVTVRVHTAPGEEAQVDPSAGLRAGFWLRGILLRSSDRRRAAGARVCRHTVLQSTPVCRGGL